MTVMSNDRNKASVKTKEQKIYVFILKMVSVWQMTDDFSCQPVSTYTYFQQKDTFPLNSQEAFPASLLQYWHSPKYFWTELNGLKLKMSEVYWG